MAITQNAQPQKIRQVQNQNVIVAELLGFRFQTNRGQAQKVSLREVPPPKISENNWLQGIYYV